MFIPRYLFTALVLTLLTSALAVTVVEVQPCFYDSISTSNYITDCRAGNIVANYRPGQLAGTPTSSSGYSGTFTYNLDGLNNGTTYVLHFDALMYLNGGRTVSVQWNGVNQLVYSHSPANPAFYQVTVNVTAGPSTNTLALSDSSTGTGSTDTANFYRFYLIQ